MNKNEIQQLAQKYLDGTATAEEKRLLDQWYNTIHDDDQIVNVAIEEPESEADIKQRIFANLHRKIKQEPEPRSYPGVLRRLYVQIASVAAVIIIISSVSWYFSRVNSTVQLADTALVNIVAPKIMEITLSDGSKVWLNARSVFRYPKTFGSKNRQVELIEGRAFFDVKHQVSHPFIVKTKSLNITVLGTSFDVRTYQKEGTTKVSVLTGKVGITLTGNTSQRAIMLLPKQQIVLSKLNNQLKKEITHESVVNLWCKSPLVFEQENLNNIFKAIEKQYNTHIKVDNKKLLDERISITLGNQRLDTIMEILSFTKHFKYQMANDSTVVIK
ncbi:FecR family protein [Mucilaginibacter sp. OK098]|uniref:FecR family protein n=1 Tax=Mucilaginibacter sp. OK098 TaxID=1855297 RepID=UPI00091A154D|nr:FecR family protein [Mucilaginibacter sp. OK098]SHM90421.1 FecR family protein [Mucilaginibacter sp. OK098]